AKAQVGPMLEAMIVEHERDYRGTRMEWPCVMQAAHYSYNAACIFSELMQNLRINDARLAQNVEELSQFLFVEHLLNVLSTKIGRGRAFDIVYEISQISLDLKENIRSRALQSEQLKSHISKEEIEDLFKVENFIGEASAIVNTVIAQIDGLTGTKIKRSA
ncbi:MAG: hypothetical protein AB7F86_11075, partial [Bdellovibrionales bacterium]